MSENKDLEIKELKQEIKLLRRRLKKIDDLEAERNLFEKSLRFRNRLQRLITALSTKFISIQPDEIDYWIKRALKIICNFAEADRASVLQLYNSNNNMDQTHEWCTKGIDSAADKTEGIDLTQLKYFRSEIVKRNDIVLFSKYQLPEGYTADEEFLDTLGIKSFLMVPLVIRDMLIGYISVSSVNRETIWTKEILLLLKIVGEIIVGALVRKRAEDKLRQYHMIVTNSNEHMAIIDSDYVFQSLNDAYLKAFWGIENNFLGYPVDKIYGDDFFLDVLKPNIDKCLKGEEVRFQTWIEYPALGKIYMAVVYDPVITEDGSVVGVVETARDISKQKAAEDELVFAKEKAERADQLKTEFLAQISHEIRTPINSMLSFSSMLQEETQNVLDEELQNSFNIIGKAGKRIIRTTDLILEMSELQAGTYEPDFKEEDIYSEVIEDVFCDFLTASAEKGIELNIEKSTEECVVKYDKHSMKQVFNNIVNNAVTFTNEGSINIKVKRENGSGLTVEIADTGIGIARENQEKIFEPFTQEDEGFTREYEGTGLGLPLARKYCEINNAELTLTSEKNIGTKVFVKFR
ncbi:MAG: ATP-binding protein [Rhodothermaceae bacterium]